MTSVVGTALAVVAAGSLVLFSVVLQRSAFDATGWRPLDTRAPRETATTTVQVPGFEENTEGGSTVADLGSEGGAPLSPDAGDLLSPFPSDDLAGEGLVAGLDEPPGDADIPTLDGGTGVTGISGGPGPSLSNSGPEATINNDLSGPGKPGHEPLPGNDGPKLVNPPHGEPGDGNEDEDNDGEASPDSPEDGDDHDGDRDHGNHGDDHNSDRDRDRDHGNHGDDHDSDRDRGDNDSKDRDSKPHKASKTPKAHQPKPPEPKGDDDDHDDDDDDGHGRDHSDRSGHRGDDSSGD